MPPEQPTIAQPFKQAGYHTAYFGKWHVDGFHESEGRGGDAHHPARAPRRLRPLGRLRKQQQPVGLLGARRRRAMRRFPPPPARLRDGRADRPPAHLSGRAGGTGDGRSRSSPSSPCSRRTIPTSPRPSGWRATRPRQIALRPNVPAIPRVIEQARRELAGYYAMIENADWNIGRVLAKLDATGPGRQHARALLLRPRRHARLARHVPQDQPLGGVDPHPVPDQRAAHGLHASPRRRDRADQPRGHRADDAGPLRHRRAGLDGGHGLLRASAARKAAGRTSPTRPISSA